MADEYMTCYHFTKCSFGSREEYINLPVDHGVTAMTTGQPLLNANDHKYEGPERNIHGYRLCKRIGICRPRTPKVWIKTANKHLIEGAPALTEKSELMCMHGGIITFCDPPADVQQKMKEQEEAQKVAQELQEAQENSDSSYMGEDGMGDSMESDTGEWEDNDRTGTGHKELVKEVLNDLIDKRIIPAPENMTGDYCVATVGINLPFNTSAGIGIIYDRMGNIYDLGEVAVSRGKSFSRVQISVGEGSIPVLKKMKTPKQYSDTIAGKSIGIDRSSILQAGFSGTWPNGPEGAEIKISAPNIGVNGSWRKVECIGNLYEKTDYESVLNEK